MAEKRRSPCALSVKAHAFSVEALIGAEKRRRTAAEDALSPGYEDGTDASDLTGSPGGPRADRACTSDRGSEAECASDGSPESEDALLESPQPAAAALCAAPVGGTGEETRVDLQGSDLWKRFHEIGTEMIITKAGRRMFPAMRVKITGLDPHQQYYIAMDIIPVDNKRYRYVYHSSKWMVAGNADSPVPPRVYIHPDSPASGETWMRQVVSFDKLKLTNNELDDQGHPETIICPSPLRSFFTPCTSTSRGFHVIRKECGEELSPVRAIPAGEGTRTFSFPETVFTTVTAYQNQQITRLKIDRNPFAKGFRDSGRNRMGLEALVESYAFWRPSLRTLTFEDIPGMAKQESTNNEFYHNTDKETVFKLDQPCQGRYSVPNKGSQELTEGSERHLTSSPRPHAPHLSRFAPSARPTTPAADPRTLSIALATPQSRFPLPEVRQRTRAKEGFCSLPLPASQLGYLSNPTPQGYAGLRLHTPPYSLYGYTFPPSPRLAASPDKMAAAATANHQSAFLGSSPSGTLTDSLGVLSGGQQGLLFDSRTLGLAGSQAGGGASQVTAHMG
ncbi:hypothetical protein L3Q82_011303 [Scortum barcoo]|uniref:Uncharacterized protein n=1 Tax=Scortum barcoo TaxID=214431 RepID=A0ACB8WA31_9TELE|nr:hypothetical protein L3Q82_011303 [Scortum barcoo]